MNYFERSGQNPFLRTILRWLLLAVSHLVITRAIHHHHDEVSVAVSLSTTTNFTTTTLSAVGTTFS